jgi:hypothetical protein
MAVSKASKEMLLRSKKRVTVESQMDWLQPLRHMAEMIAGGRREKHTIRIRNAQMGKPVLILL